MASLAKVIIKGQNNTGSAVKVLSLHMSAWARCLLPKMMMGNI